jgi:divalent metal cation (Fe/Co/Zn/Cd) transporter
MGFASFGVLKESLETLYEGMWSSSKGELGNVAESFIQDENWSSFWSMFSVVFVKLALYALCMKVGHVRSIESDGDDKYYVDSTLEAVAQDHWNDCLSNAVAAVALVLALSNDRLWVLDPIGAIIISLYIIYSWYETGKEQIEQLTGKAAPSEFIEELYEVANNFDAKVCSIFHVLRFCIIWLFDT